MMNLRFDIGEKSRGIVEPLFSPIPKGDVVAVVAVVVGSVEQLDDLTYRSYVGNMKKNMQ